MPILPSFEENKLEYEDEDEVEIKMMGTEMDKESLEHIFYENDITPIVCHIFSPTSNTPIKPKDSSIFRMKEFLKKENKFFTDPGDGVRINPDSRKAYLLKDKQITSVGVFSTWMAFGGNTRDLGSLGEETDEITDLHQILEEVLLTKRGDDVASIKRRRRDPSSDGVSDLVTASGRG
ncbi:hypothetical protein Tco_0096688 [Tanacetum coccineum]